MTNEDKEKLWPDPTPEMLVEADFNLIWKRIKTWDINVPEVYGGYCGATGNHVRSILDALKPYYDSLKRENDELKRALEDSNGILEAIHGDLSDMARCQLHENKLILKSLPQTERGQSGKGV